MHARLAVLALCLFAFAAPASSLTLDEVRRSLGEFRGASPLNVRIESRDQRTDGKEKWESSGASVAEDDGTHLRMVHDKNELRRLKKKSKDRSDHTISANFAFDLMNYAPKLLKTLDGAALKKVTQTSLDGAPATLLEITPVREKDEDGDKWVKSYADTLLLWVGAGGVPLAAERTLKIKLRIVVIGAEFEQKEKFRFLRAGDRLIVTRTSDESSSSGLGQKEHGVKTATVAILR